MNGSKLSIVIEPSKKGNKNITKYLLFKNIFKINLLNLKFFFQFEPFLNNQYFFYGHILLDVKFHAPKLYQILDKSFLFLLVNL